MSLQDLSVDILSYITHNLSVTDIINLIKTCKLMKDKISSNDFWRLRL